MSWQRNISINFFSNIDSFPRHTCELWGAKAARQWTRDRRAGCSTRPRFGPHHTPRNRHHGPNSRRRMHAWRRRLGATHPCQPYGKIIGKSYKGNFLFPHTKWAAFTHRKTFKQTFNVNEAVNFKTELIAEII